MTSLIRVLAVFVLVTLLAGTHAPPVAAQTYRNLTIIVFEDYPTQGSTAGACNGIKQAYEPNVVGRSMWVSVNYNGALSTYQRTTNQSGWITINLPTGAVVSFVDYPSHQQYPNNQSFFCRIGLPPTNVLTWTVTGGNGNQYVTAALKDATP